MDELRIGICDDKAEVVSELKEILMTILKKNEDKYGSYIIYEWTSSRKLLKESEKLDMVFLDIDMPDMNGIELGKELKKTNPYCEIVMATGILDCVNEAFKINAKRYITKPFKESEVEEALVFLVNQRIGHEGIRLFQNRREVMVKQKDISNIIAYDSCVELKVGDGLYRLESSLTQLEQVLDKRMFFRINRKEIINLMYVNKSHQNTEEYLMFGKRINISRRNRALFNKAYLEYDLYYRRG